MLPSDLNRRSEQPAITIIISEETGKVSGCDSRKSHRELSSSELVEVLSEQLVVGAKEMQSQRLFVGNVTSSKVVVQMDES